MSVYRHLKEGGGGGLEIKGFYDHIKDILPQKGGGGGGGFLPLWLDPACSFSYLL